MHIFGHPQSTRDCKYRWFWRRGSLNHDIYSLFCLWKQTSRYLQCFFPGRSKVTGIHAGFSVLQDVVSIYGKHRNTVFLRCFCFPTTDKKVQQWLKNGHFGACVRPSWPILTHLGAMLAHLGAMLARLGALAHLGAIGPSWGYAGPSWGASWASLGLCWPNLGPVWGLCWATWTHLDPS